MRAEELIAFEKKVKEEFDAGKVSGPVHLSGGNERQLVEIFEKVFTDDWVFSTWRSHYHALLHGVSPEWLLDEVKNGRSICIHNRRRKVFTSAIVGGIIPIALGVAMAGQRVWCFVGDMAASCGTFKDCLEYAENFDLPITFVVEDNGYSTDTPTKEAWGKKPVWFGKKVIWYSFERNEPHIGTQPDAVL